MANLSDYLDDDQINKLMSLKDQLPNANTLPSTPSAATQLNQILTQSNQQPAMTSPVTKTEDNEDDNDDSEDDTSTNNLLSKLKNLPKSTSQPQDVAGSIATLMGNQSDRLNNAENSRNNIQLLAMLGKAGQTAGAGIAGVKPVGDEAFNQLSQQANQPVQDLITHAGLQKEGLQTAELGQKLQTEMEKNDPNSPTSEIFRDIIEKMGYKRPSDNVSASSLEKVFGPIERYAGMKEMQAYRQTTLGNKNDKTNKDYEKAALTQVAQMRGEKAAQNAQEAIRLANQTNILFNKYKGQLTPELSKLAVQDVARLSLGGVPGSSEIESLMPLKDRSAVTKLWQEVSGNPTNVPGMQKFLNKYKDYIDDLKKTNTEYLSNRVDRVLDPWGDIIDPKRLKSLKDKELQGVQQMGVTSFDNKSTGPHGPSVTQNGHTYNWNAQTGKYE